MACTVGYYPASAAARRSFATVARRVPMMPRLALATLFLASLLACSGKDGAAGPAGKDGVPGSTGPAGNSSGTVQGTVTDPNGTGLAGATVTFVPGGVVATAGSNGAYSLPLPIGVYQATARLAGFADASAAGVSVAAGLATAQDFSLAVAPPSVAVVASAGPDVFQAGFGAVVQLDASGSTAPADATFSWNQISGPDASASLSNPNVANPTFTTLTLAEAESNLLFAAPDRYGLVGFSAGDVRRLTYVFEVTVSSGAVSDRAQVSIQPIVPQPGFSISGVGVLAAAATRVQQASYAWTCAVRGTGGAETPCPAGVLSDPTARAVTVRPPAAGIYALQEAGAATPLLVTAATYVGARPISNGVTCSTCHGAAVIGATATGGRTITEKYGAWLGTRHASFFSVAIDGNLQDSSGAPVAYQQSCIRCHTTGYNPEAANGGFDDVASAAGWTFPTPITGNWDALPERLKSLASVTCENCHGPGSAHAPTGDPAGITRGFGADTCAQCHAKEPYESQGLQWVNSRHARFVTGAVPGPGDPALLPGCSSCHTSQGFVAWMRTGSNAQPGQPADLAEPQTCIACHDPHGEAVDPSGQPTFRQLRVYDDVTTLSGVGARGVGGAALCLKCHNRQQSFSPLTQLAPHFAAEGDLLLAKGAEGFGSPYPTSAHGAVPKLCVGCHMAPTPALPSPEHNLVGGHSVALTTGTFQHLGACTGCHAGLTTFNRIAYADFDGDGMVAGVQDETKGLVSLLGAALATQAASLWPVQTRTVGVAVPNLAVVVQQGVIRLLGHYDPLAGQPPTNLGDCDPLTPAASWPEQCFAFPAGQIPASPGPEEDFLRAAWNLFLVKADGSRGVHNAAYTISVLQRSYQTVAGQPVPGATLR